VATGYTSTASTSITNMADLYEKTNTDVKTAIKLVTEEAKWFRSYPKENITVSANENRVPLILNQPLFPANIAEGGNERIMATPVPQHGTFLPVQMNVRYGFTGLAQALDARARGAQIQNQIEYQANMAGYSIGRGIGLSTYGQSTGTVAVVKTTGSAGTTQNGVAIKNAYGSATFVPGGDGTLQDTYLSSLFRVGDHVALIRSAAIVEFASVVAAPSAASGVGFIDLLFTSSITPTVGDLIVFANADGDNTISGTDVNNWAIGFTEILTASSLLGLATSAAAEWTTGSTSTTSQRYSFVVKEKMINDCWNKGGVRINKFIMDQGVRRDAISGQLGGRRYDGPEVDIEGDLSAGKGESNYTSQLALPATVIGWYDKAVSKIELSDLPEDGASKSIFKLDKVQGKSQVAASYDYFYQRIPTSRRATGYATGLTST
jgi:hypothetical protein